MLLCFNDLTDILPEKQGITVDMDYYTVSDRADEVQPKGLYVPLGEESGELSNAIANGAIAVIWDKSKGLPRYTPNHFPVFFTRDPHEAIIKLITCYFEKLNGEQNQVMEMTNFKISNKKLLNKNNETYDIAVMLKQLREMQENKTERRG